MVDFKNRQADHLKKIISDQGITKGELAYVGGVSPQSVSAWMSGASAMRDYSAYRIHEKWPEYPIEWIRGFTEAKNPEELTAEKMKQAASIGEMKNALGNCLLSLAGWSFDTYELDFDPDTTKPTYWMDDADAFITSPMLDGWWRYGSFDIENERHYITMATLQKDSKRLDLPLYAWFQLLQRQIDSFDFEIEQQIAAQSDLAYFQGFGQE